MTKRIHLVAGARPNFMKVAPLYHALRAEAWCEPLLVHTGQHYDARMSDAFLRDLNLPEPDLHLGIGSGTHAEQTAGVMVAYEKVCRESPPYLVVVTGDVNSTLACSLAAKKLGLPVAHVEAGLRSGDRSMPEELNRLVTDVLADYHWTPSADADANLLREGIAAASIRRVGNIMIDSLEMTRSAIEARDLPGSMGLAKRGFGLVTLHRPANVDDPATLNALVDTLSCVAGQLPLVFPVHPRTRRRLEAAGLLQKLDACAGVRRLEPLGYIDFMSLLFNARLVITDSGGVQEETTYLGIHCLTLRPNTERPITVTDGTNRLVRPDKLLESVQSALSNDDRPARRLDLWDGRTASRIVSVLREIAGVRT